MWFRRKPKNRRFKREHLLEVKASSQQRRHTRWRLGMTAASLLLGLLILSALFWAGGSWLVNRLVYQNEFFAIAKIDAQTDGVISLEQIRKWSEVKINDNLMLLDLVNVQRNLELVPLIREVAVERIMPRTLKIRVAERVPVAQVHAFQPRSAGGGYDVVVYFLDEGGFVMARPERWLPGARAWRSVETLPVICGLDGSELHPGWTNDSPRIQAALQLIAAFEGSSVFAVADLMRIDVSAPEVIQATTYQGSEITLLPRRLEWQLSRWRLIHDVGAKQGKAIASLDLSVSNNLPARWIEASAVPPVNPKLIKTIRTKKKNAKVT
jgi:hypothetical protein